MLLGYTWQCAIFQNQSVPEVVAQVLRKHGLEYPGCVSAVRL
ncbi:hypothetical protein V4841_05425 [Lelliottia amnigena]|uniref:Uncharacterized protein n=1 Tax=Lelliottia amnigena TaxID=61646 RepID=A0ABU7UBJ9_LELAM